MACQDIRSIVAHRPAARCGSDIGACRHGNADGKPSSEQDGRTRMAQRHVFLLEAVADVTEHAWGRTTTSAQRASDTADGRTKLRRWIDESPFAPDRTTLHLKPKHNSLDRECERVHTVCLVLAAQHGVVPSAHCHPQQVCSLAGRREHGRSIPFADLVQCQLLYRLLGVKQTRYAQREFFRV